MGQKCHPTGLRLGINKDWQSRWYAQPRAYANFVVEDNRIRKHVLKRFARDNSTPGRATGGGRGAPREVGLARVEIERAANTLRITLHTARPGLIIGRGGRGVDDLRADLEGLTDRKIHITVQEIRDPGLDGQLVAESIASQIERRVAFKRAVRQAVQRTMREGAKGIRVIVSGRLAGAEIARSYRDHEGKIPLQTLRADIDYGYSEAVTTYGNIGVRTWIYRGDVLPEAVPRAPKLEVMPTAAPKEHKGWRRVGVVRSTGEEEGELLPEAEGEAPAPVEPMEALAAEPLPETAEVVPPEEPVQAAPEPEKAEEQQIASDGENQ
jgi:small subunit ribosomal protein S3